MFFKKKENCSLDELFLKKKNILVAIAFDIIKDKDEIDDILQEVYLSVNKNWEKICEFDEEKQFSYICVATRNQTITVYRKMKKILEKETPLDEYIDAKHEITLEHLIVSKEMLAETKRSILALDEHLRLVLELSVFHQLSDEVIAKQLNISVNSVRVRKYRARQEVKKNLAEVNNDGRSK